VSGDQQGGADDARNVELMRRVYGFDWAAVGSRERGFGEMRDLVAEDFESLMSDELGARTVGLAGLADFVTALEQDFSEFTYEADEFVPAPGGRVVVTGRIRCVGRASKVPLNHEFGHVWTIEDGKAVRVEGRLDRAAALRAAASA
jgi:hypothetical protein